jgi:hypothetical protein
VVFTPLPPLPRPPLPPPPPPPRARVADRRLRSAISAVAEELVVVPVRAELMAYDTVREGLARALA